MKKNKMTRAASVLLVLTLVSTSFMAGVLAKYVISDGSTDTARVAKFGVVTSVEGSLFGTSYKVGTTSDDGVIQSWSVNKQSVSSSGSGSADSNVVAPGTHNSKGMTLSVTGTPEVSTRVIIDYPEGDGNTTGGLNGSSDTDDADFVNTDIYLAHGAYYIMQACYANTEPASDSEGYPIVTVTTDNYSNYYTFTEGDTTTSGTFAVLAGTDSNTDGIPDAVAAGGVKVYKKVQLTGANAASTMSASVTEQNSGDSWQTNGYYPIQWKVGGTKLAATGSGVGSHDNNVAGVFAAIGDDITATLTQGTDALFGDGGTTKYYADYTPNQDLSSVFGKTVVTWEWDFSTADGDSWKDVASDQTLQNWENTTIEDLCDTVLGEMAAQATDFDGTSHTGKIDEYIIAVDKSGTLTEVKYAEVGAAATSANTALYAYAGSIPTAGTYTDVVACLTETFGARLTVVQID